MYHERTLFIIITIVIGICCCLNFSFSSIVFLPAFSLYLYLRFLTLAPVQLRQPHPGPRRLLVKTTNFLRKYLLQPAPSYPLLDNQIFECNTEMWHNQKFTYRHDTNSTYFIDVIIFGWYRGSEKSAVQQCAEKRREEEKKEIVNVMISFSDEKKCRKVMCQRKAASGKGGKGGGWWLFALPLLLGQPLSIRVSLYTKNYDPTF